MVQAIAVSQPPPSAKPLTAAISGPEHEEHEKTHEGHEEREGQEARHAEALDEVEYRLSVAGSLLCFDCCDISELADVRSRDKRFIARSRKDNAEHPSVIPGVLESRFQALTRP